MDKAIPGKRIITGIDVDIEKKGIFVNSRICYRIYIRLCPYLQWVSDALQCPDNRHHR